MGKWPTIADGIGFLETPDHDNHTNSVGSGKDAVWNGMWIRIVTKVRGGTLSRSDRKYDGFLNDIYGFHVKADMSEAASNAALVKLTKMSDGGYRNDVFGFQSGTENSSRIVKIKKIRTSWGWFRLNFGRKPSMTIAGVPVGQAIEWNTRNNELKIAPNLSKKGTVDIVVSSYRLPLLPIIKRIAIGFNRSDSQRNGTMVSGDISLSIFTANRCFSAGVIFWMDMLPNDPDRSLLEATASCRRRHHHDMNRRETWKESMGNKSYTFAHELPVWTCCRKYNRLKILRF